MLEQAPEAAVWSIMLLPLGSFALISLASLFNVSGTARWDPRWSGYLTIVSVGAAFVLSLWVLDSAIDADGHRFGFPAHQWIALDALHIDIGLTVDGLAAIMLLVVTGVSFLVQVYSQGYMAGDPGYSRYYAFMSLFTGSMLGLVLASSLLQLFVFWELVGLSSYLLIGFWFQRDSARRAATKAFLVTRIGDLGLLSAILLVWTQTGELDIAGIQEAALAGAIGSGVIAFFAGGVFAGAAGKSAQFPLHVWLPDAMEGPTPVSALIHAATMVAAGVYLVARLFPVFAVSEEAINAVAAVGAITAIISALLGIVATDIKRVMAYSTISQLGYMMMALGVAGFVPAIFHLFTHAFFKALLFLGAGSVNHATGTFDMRKMGGLSRYMPVTFAATTIAGLALVGVFPLAGFWSKDEILADAWEARPVIFWVALIGVFLTALYVGRMLFLTFAGQYRGGEASAQTGGRLPEHGASHARPHEAPWVMAAPLIVLALLAAGAGFVNISDGLHHLLSGALPEGAEELQVESDFQIAIAIASTLLGLGGLAIAWALYGRGAAEVPVARRVFGPLAQLLERKYYLDDLYEGVLVRRVILRTAAFFLFLWDMLVVDRFVNGVAGLARSASQRLRLAQSGQTQAYGAAIFIGVMVAVAAILLTNP
ncbi:MAG TPA: NADH-quinone oxidoreductase subunit L [Dehalococcoidia bacterium]|nr:NADH-quinone oxidoreductase subunit L [Dehalococcoidia bacterium]